MKIGSCKITSEQVRLLLFKECDWKARKLLFDSASIERIPASKDVKLSSKKSDDKHYIVEASDGFAYLYKGESEDATVLGEMIFGAVAMNYRGVSLKIHIMEEPRRLMCTKVFYIPPSSRLTDYRNGSRQGSVTQIDRSDVSLGSSFNRVDSGFCNGSSQSSVASYDFLSTLDWDKSKLEGFYSFHSSNNKLKETNSTSWQRRALKSIATRFDFSADRKSSTPNSEEYKTKRISIGAPELLTSNGLKSDSFDATSHTLNISSSPIHNVRTVSTVMSDDSQVYSASTMSTCGSISSASCSTPNHRKRKLGLALLITLSDSTEMDMLDSFVQQAATIDALAGRLRAAALAAASGNAFIGTLYRAATDTATWLSHLLYGPRVQPIWSSLVSAPLDAANKIAEGLISDLCAVLAVADTKDTNFFISTLLTHVLTYHLGWVATVSPYESLNSETGAYNALWAQLSDLTGSIGHPRKSARTILCANSNLNFLNKLLKVLTYFMRCGDIQKSEFRLDDQNLRGAIDNQINLKRPPVKSKAEAEEGLSKVLPNQEIKPMSSQMKRNVTMSNLKVLPDSISSSDSDSEKVVFVLGEDEKLVGLKNKSVGGKSVKKSKPNCVCDKQRDCSEMNGCCQTEHSKPIKHSGFKFEFDKYPQIVTNYMKSKNLEILDRHYIGKPGNLKMDFQLDPTVIPPLEEPELCNKCQESMIQTAPNASELEYFNDATGEEPQYAKEVISKEDSTPKTFVRMKKENTVVVNVTKCSENECCVNKASDLNMELKPMFSPTVLEFPMVDLDSSSVESGCGFESSLLGGITDHYVPDLVLQGTLASPKLWEKELRRDIEISTYANSLQEPPVQSLAIIGDLKTWEVSVVGGGVGGGGMSALVGGMLDALPHMREARVPAHQCLTFIECKLREIVVLSRGLSSLLMSGAICDIPIVTKSLNIDANDVPLLLAVASTHTPDLAQRYTCNYR